jgi:hypothetical protein
MLGYDLRKQMGSQGSKVIHLVTPYVALPRTVRRIEQLLVNLSEPLEGPEATD